MYDRLNDYYRQKYEAEKAMNQPEQPILESDRAHLHTMGAGAWLPIIQAMITGFVFGLAASWFSYLLDWPTGVEPWKVGITTFATVQAFSWLSLLGRWMNLTVPLEKLLNRDLNRDGKIGEPEIHTVRIELTRDLEGGGRQTVYIDLPTTKEKLTALAKGLLSGASFSEGTWTGAGAPFSRSEFRAVRAELLKRGMLEPANDKDSRQGFLLSPPGKAAMRYFASMAASPSPTQDVRRS